MAAVLAICDKETAFVQIFSEYLKKKYKMAIEIEAFDHAEKLLFSVKQRPVGLCLIGEGMLEAFQLEELLEHSQQIFYLSGKRKKDCVFKFQSVRQVTRDLLLLCEEKNISFFEEQSFLPGRREVKLIAFYAPVHHILQSSVALMMGQILAKEKKVLYLNLEPYSGFEYLMQKKFQKDLMDLFFYLKEEKEKFRLKLESMTEQIGNLDYIPPVFCYPDMEEMDLSLWKKLLQRVINETDYEVILLDLTEQTRGVFSLLEVCDEIYTCLADEGLVLAKADQYERLLMHMQKKSILEHTVKSKMPVFQEIPLSAAMFTHGELVEYVKGLLAEAELRRKDGEECERV